MRFFFAAVVLVKSLVFVVSSPELEPIYDELTNCHIFDANDIESYNYEDCTTTRFTGLFFDLDGFMVFKGLSRIVTAGACHSCIY